MKIATVFGIAIATMVSMGATECSGPQGPIDLSPGKPIIGNIDSSLLKKCNLPVQIPERVLTRAEVEYYWSVDRESLLICAKRHGFLGDAIRFRDQQLTGTLPTTEELKKKK
jgi:hypothetical protein